MALYAEQTFAAPKLLSAINSCKGAGYIIIIGLSTVSQQMLFCAITTAKNAF